MDTTRVLGLMLFGALTVAIGWDVFHEWNQPEAKTLAPLCLALFFFFLRFVLSRPVSKDQPN